MQLNWKVHFFLIIMLPLKKEIVGGKGRLDDGNIL